MTELLPTPGFTGRDVLAERVGIPEVYFSQSPEQKLDLVRAETQRANSLTDYDPGGPDTQPALGQ